MDDMHPFGGIEDLFTDILSLGQKIHRSDFEKQSMGLHQEIWGAYENLLSITMKIRRQQNRQKAMKPKTQLISVILKIELCFKPFSIAHLSARLLYQQNNHKNGLKALNYKLYTHFYSKNIWTHIDWLDVFVHSC